MSVVNKKKIKLSKKRFSQTTISSLVPADVLKEQIEDIADISIIDINEDEKEKELLVDIGFDLCKGKISMGYIESLIEDDNTIQGFIVKHKRKYLGFILYNKNKNKTWHIALVCVNRQFSFKGVPIGKLIMTRLEKMAFNEAVKKITLDAVDDAVKFYESIGYKKVKSLGGSLELMSKKVKRIK